MHEVSQRNVATVFSVGEPGDTEAIKTQPANRKSDKAVQGPEYL